MNRALLRDLGAGAVFGGEFEAGLLGLAQRLQSNPQDADQVEEPISLERQRFRVPDRDGLPPLPVYAQLRTGDDARVVGYTEASRGCKHACRHCPIVPVYEGRFRVVQKDVVLQDVRQQVAAGAEHITFGDPDFFNGIGHALPLVHDLHREFPELTYDVTIKIEHLLLQARHLPTLRDTGCVMVTSAVESVQDGVLRLLDKGHTRADFLHALALCRQAGICLNPTFVAFMPWVSLADYIDLLAVIAAQGLIDHVAPIQLAMRLLIPDGSKLLELPETRAPLREFDADALSYRWEHPDPRMDAPVRRSAASGAKRRGRRRLPCGPVRPPVAHRPQGRADPRASRSGSRRRAAPRPRPLPGRTLVLLSGTHRGAGCSVLGLAASQRSRDINPSWVVAYSLPYP